MKFNFIITCDRQIDRQTEREREKREKRRGEKGERGREVYYFCVRKI